MLQLRASVADSGPVSKNICVIGMDHSWNLSNATIKTKKSCSEKTQKQPSVIASWPFKI